MYQEKTILAIIPARGGSKGVPRKNIRTLGDKPLIAWTIESAKKSEYIDRVILSSEDEEIISVAKKWGCEVPFVRPEELAQDHTSGIAPVLHAVEVLPDYDFVVLLQPTSPMRSVDDIDNCIKKCIDNYAMACVSVAEVEQSPYWMYSIGSTEKISPVLPLDATCSRRQDLPKVYMLNGAIYVANIKWFKQSKTFLTSDTIAYVMPKERSVDIDTELDFQSINNCVLANR